MSWNFAKLYGFGWVRVSLFFLDIIWAVGHNGDLVATDELWETRFVVGWFGIGWHPCDIKVIQRLLLFNHLTLTGSTDEKWLVSWEESTLNLCFLKVCDFCYRWPPIHCVKKVFFNFVNIVIFSVDFDFHGCYGCCRNLPLTAKIKHPLSIVIVFKFLSLWNTSTLKRQ